MTTKICINPDTGEYLGSFIDCDPEVPFVEVFTMPNHGSDRWDAVTSKWIPSNTLYKVQRYIEYPPMADYLDAVVKGDTVAMQDYIDTCLAVKAKYPKPI